MNGNRQQNRECQYLATGRVAKRLLASVLSLVLALQPVLVQAQQVAPDTTAPSANQPGISVAPNGVPLVNIATPNSQGLSHNKYDSFNVGAPGLILNNYNGEVGTSNLGGVLPGNPNLRNAGSAGVILNEVTRGSRSALNGPTEVFGGRADVIIANPKGITCNGCGFINTPHATLTTGVPDLTADGRLNGFIVRGGDVTFGSNGTNLAAGVGAVDLFDVVSRTISVNGPIFGKDLRLTAGKAKFDYATGKATDLDTTTGTPEYAIDGSALGAMQGDRIKMVVTEKGAGVRMHADMAANAGELSLSADGRISIGNASGSQGVAITSHRRVDAGNLTSKAHVVVKAKEGITLHSIAADRDVSLDGGTGLISLSGDTSSLGSIQISAGDVATGDLRSGSSVAVAAVSGDIFIGDVSAAAGDLTLSAISGAIAAGTLISTDNLAITAGLDIALSGDAMAGGNVAMSGRSVSVGGITSGFDVAATAAATLGAVVLSGTGDLTLSATAGNIEARQLLSAGELKATASRDISANAISHKSLKLDAGNVITLTGQSLAASDVSVQANQLNIDTLISGVDFDATTLSSSGSIVVGTDGTLLLVATQGSIAARSLFSAGDLSAHASQDITYDSLQSYADANLAADLGIISLENITRAAGDISVAERVVDLSDGQSGISTAGTLRIKANSANFSGSTLTFGGLDITVGGTANVKDATLNATSSSGGSGDLLISATTLAANMSTNLRAAGDLDLTLPFFTNSGELAAGHDVTITTSGDLTNAATGLIYAGHDANIFVLGDMLNDQGAILAGHDLSIAGDAGGTRSGSITNRAGLLQAGNDAALVTSNLVNERSSVPALTNVLVSSGVVSRFSLNPTAAGLPFAYMESADQNMYQLYPGMNPPQFADYQPLLWSVATLPDGTTYHAWTWISGNGPTAVAPIFNWIKDRVPKDANGNPILDPNNPSQYFIVDQVMLGGVADTSTTYTFDGGANLSQSVYEDRFAWPLGAQGLIQAGGNLTVDATTLTNSYSAIEAGGNATLKGNVLNNRGVSLTRTTTTTCHADGACEGYDASGTRNPSKDIANGTTIINKTESIGGASATIKAGGAVNISGFAAINNTSVAGSIAGASNVAPSNSHADPTAVLSGISAGGALFTLNAAAGGASGAALQLALANSTPKPQSGGFGGTIPGQTFLFETRAQFLDVGAFYGSSYFISHLGYQPDTERPFLGDAYFENQYIDQLLRQTTGQGLGTASFIPGSDAVEQVKTLLDNGLQYATDHGLNIGQTLTADQVASLTEPLVWYETQTIDGVSVLAPVVYIPNTDMAQLTAAGALISGGSVRVDDGTISNSGAMVADSRLSVSGSTISTNGGTFKASGDVTLAASGTITLQAQSLDLGVEAVVNSNAAVVAGADATLTAGSDLALKGAAVKAGGDLAVVGRDVTLDSLKVAVGAQQNASGTQLASGGALTIAAANDVNVIGSSAKAGTTLDVTAGRGSVNVITTSLDRNTDDGYSRTSSTDQQKSQLGAGTDATIKAGDSILLSGSSVNSGGDAVLQAANTINVTVSQGESDPRFGKNTSSTFSHSGSEIAAGGAISATAGQDLSIVGSKLTAEDTVDLKAGGDVTIAQATDSSTLDLQSSTKKGGLFGSKSASTSHLETETAVGSAISGAAGVTIVSGENTQISASTIQAGTDQTKANLTVTTGGDLIVAAAEDMATRDDQKNKSGFLSKGGSSYQSYDESTVASKLGASGNVTLNAGGNAVIAGSMVTAGDAITASADSISVIGAQERHQLEIERKKSGLFAGSGDGFLSLWGKEQKDLSQASELNIASLLSAGTDLTLKARESDINIIGSGITAGQDIALEAARDVNITPGAESASSAEKEKRSGFGIAYSSGDGSASIGIGFGKSVDQTAQSSATNAVSSLSAGRDLTISAARDVNLQAAQVSGERDVAILAERDVNLLSAQDQTNYEQLHEEFFAGISLSVSTSLLTTAQSVGSAAKKIGEISDGYSTANAAFASLKAYDALDKIAKGGNVVSASLTVGFTYEKEKEAAQSSVSVLTDIRGGQSVTIEAVSGNLTSHGAQIAAGYDADGAVVISDNGKAGDIALKAGKDIILEIAQATTSSSTSNTSGGASLGVSAGVGIKGVNAGLTDSANASVGRSNADGTTQVNSHVNGTGDITVESGHDTRLAGAVVSGDTVTANVGGNLTILSVPDTGANSNRSVSGGFSLGGGQVLSGVRIGGGSGSGQTNWIAEQSSLISTGAMDVAVGGNTHLGAGKIVSESGNLLLDTGTLTYDNFEGRIGYEGFSADLGVDLSSGKDQNGESTTNHTLEGSYRLDDTRQTVRATVGPGDIIIRDEEKQAALAKDGSTTRPLNELNRDPDKAYELTKDKHVELDFYLSSNSLRAVGNGIKEAIEPGGFIDTYLLGKKLTQEEVANIKSGLAALANGGSLGGCTQQQGFNLFDLIVAPAYADDFLTDCTIRQRDGELIHLGIKSYQDCQDAIYAYLNTIDPKTRSNILQNAGFAFVVDHPLDVESWIKGDWLLDAIRKLDSDDPNGANAKAYAQGQNAAALVGEQLRGKRWEIWQDTSISWSVKIDRLEATGLDVNTIIAMAMIGVATSGGKMLGANGAQFASKTIWKGGGRERIDVENPNPGQRPGQIHYQDNNGNKYLYDPASNSFPGAPKSVNNLLTNPSFSAAIQKGLKSYLGEM
ncbi:hemagglutinin repeat-containing protein [Rhizobium sp. Root1203]|uniref:hemagglutinin repeat-containing protein n=1 Tax=Rhizobium sp. Root1203 TaxID=1736427 RepID=UPI003FCFEB68